MPNSNFEQSCWGCGKDYLNNWSIWDLSTISSFVTGNESVMVCPDCREEIESIEKEKRRIPMNVSLLTKTTLLGDEVMEKFNFEKTAALMKVCGWKWAGDPDTPTADDLRSTARSLIYTMSKNTRINNRCSTGGLVLTRFEWESSLELELIFAWERGSATGR